MTLNEAKVLKRNDYVHHVTKKNADGTPMRARVTSVKTWKTRPNEIEVHVKHGMYDYAVFRAYELGQIETGYGS
jgi:hypothetical protein